MVTVGAFDRFHGVLTYFHQLKGRVGKFFHIGTAVFGKGAIQRSAVGGGTGIRGIFLGQFGKVRAVIQFLDQRFGFFLCGIPFFIGIDGTAVFIGFRFAAFGHFRRDQNMGNGAVIVIIGGFLIGFVHSGVVHFQPFFFGEGVGEVLRIEP